MEALAKVFSVFYGEDKQILSKTKDVEKSISEHVKNQLNLLEEEAKQIIETRLREMKDLETKLQENEMKYEKMQMKMNLLYEQCEAVKPTLQDIVISEDMKLSEEQKRSINSFLNFSLPSDEVEEIKEEKKENFVEEKKKEEVEEEEEEEEEEEQQQQQKEEEKKEEEKKEEEEVKIPEKKEEPVVFKDGEENFDDEVIWGEVEFWENSVRPLKPKATNIVIKSKDPSNPNKKTETGYRFKIFYPLIEEGSPNPTYHVQTDEEETVLRIHAGKPYQDLCYRISGKNWLTNQKDGYLCKFEEKVFYLNFDLKSN